MISVDGYICDFIRKFSIGGRYLEGYQVFIGPYLLGSEISEMNHVGYLATKSAGWQRSQLFGNEISSLVTKSARWQQNHLVGNEIISWTTNSGVCQGNRLIKNEIGIRKTKNHMKLTDFMKYRLIS